MSIADKRRWLNKKLRRYSGIFDGVKAFTGPERVEIVLTNRCSNTCIFCWFYSPLLKNHIMSCNQKEKELSIDKLKKVIDDLQDMQCNHIEISGGGEPLYHPDCMSLIQYIKSKGMQCRLNTSGYLLNEKTARQLVELKLDRIDVSIWAGTPETYIDTHPGKTSKTYRNIIDAMKTMVKERKHSGFPVVAIQQGIMSLNYNDAKPMIECAEEIGVDYIYFRNFDFVADHTEHLKLTPEKANIFLTSAKNEIARLKAEKSPLEIYGFDSFRKRSKSSNADKSLYDIDSVNQIGCYMGWTYLKIDAAGDVIPCCHCATLPMGNVLQSSIKDIWNNKNYRTFRKISCQTGNKNIPYFDACNCGRICVHLFENQKIDRRIKFMQKTKLSGAVSVMSRYLKSTTNFINEDN